MSVDDALWQSLQGLTSRMDPVPAHVTTAAKESLSWRDTDAALARLVQEARLDADLAGVRGGPGPQLLTFIADDLTIELEVVVDGTVVNMVGQVVPPQSAHIEVDHGGGRTPTRADALGRFAVDGIAPGHMRLSCDPVDGDRVSTEWTMI